MSLQDSIQQDDWRDRKITAFSSLRKDRDPDILEDNELSRAENVRFSNQAIVSSIGYSNHFDFTAGEFGLEVESFLSQAGIKTNHLITDKSVYFNSGSGWSTITSDLNGNNKSQISAVAIPWSDQIAFTNGIDPVKLINPVSNTIEDLEGPDGFDTCKAVSVFDSSLWLLNTVENGAPFPQRARASAKGDITIWDAGEAFSIDLFESTEPIIGAFQLASYLIIYRVEGIHRVAITENPLKRFNVDQMVPDQGIQSVNSVTKVERNRHVFWGSDNLYSYNGGFGVEPIGSKVRDIIFGENSEEQPGEERQRSLHYLEDFELLIAAYVESGEAEPKAAIIGDLNAEAWTTRKFTHPIRGASKIPNTTSIVWEDLTGDWASQTDTWADFTEVTGSPLLVFASDDRTYQVQFSDTDDAGTAVTRTVETKDFSEYPYQGRLDWIDLRVSGGPYQVWYSTDEGANWTLYGTITQKSAPTVVRLHGQIMYESVRFRVNTYEP